MLSLVFTILQMFIFAYKYVGAIGNSMYHWVMYCYIGYFLIGGFIFFMEEMQVNLLRIMSTILFIYQVYMSYLLAVNRSVLEIMGTSPYNPFQYGSAMGYFLCYLGAIMSFGGLLTVWHYWKVNNRSSFTAG